jgi:hypothetical protein
MNTRESSTDAPARIGTANGGDGVNGFLHGGTDERSATPVTALRAATDRAKSQTQNRINRSDNGLGFETSLYPLNQPARAGFTGVAFPIEQRAFSVRPPLLRSSV